jgi:hypothetical protein
MAYRVAGIMIDARVTATREDMIEADVELKLCLLWRIPPAKKHIPRTWTSVRNGRLMDLERVMITSSILERMLPSNVD